MRELGGDHGGSRTYCGKEWCRFEAGCTKFPQIVILRPIFESDMSYDRIFTATYSEQQRARNKEHLKALSNTVQTLTDQ